MVFTHNTAMRQKWSWWSEVAVTSGHAQKDKERKHRIESDMRGGLKDLASI